MHLYIFPGCHSSKNSFWYDIKSYQHRECIILKRCPLTKRVCNTQGRKMSNSALTTLLQMRSLKTKIAEVWAEFNETKKKKNKVMILVNKGELKFKKRKMVKLHPVVTGMRRVGKGISVVHH